MSPADDVTEILNDIVGPRLSGTPGHASAAERVRTVLEEAGYECTPLPFEFSAWAGRFGVSAGAFACTTGTFVGAVLLLMGSSDGALIACLAGFGIGLVLVASWLRLLHTLPWGRQQGLNLLFRRPASAVRCVVMAHLDTKSQFLPLSLRTQTLVASGIGWVILVVGAALVGGAGATVAGLPVEAIALGGGLLAVSTGVALTLSWAGNRTPGALDNASGVAAAIGVALRERAGDVAILITDAEELGLAGARSAAPTLRTLTEGGFGVINLDGLDDLGGFFLVDRFGFPPRGPAPHLAHALLAAARELTQPAHHRPVLPGLLLDHMPVATAGVPAISVLRGSLQSLRRVHRPMDDLDHLDGSGVRATVDLVCAALRHLRETTRAPEA